MLSTHLIAYIDPVSGSILLQAIFAGVLGSLVFFRKSLAAVAGWLTGRKVAVSSEPPAPNKETQGS